MIVKQAKDYIVFPLDVPTFKRARSFVQKLEGNVGTFKVGLELFIASGPDVIHMIRQESNAKIFLDLKLHDISATVQRATARAASLGVDLITVHCASSKNILEKAVKGSKGKTGVLGVTLLTDNDAGVVENCRFKEAYVCAPDILVMKRAQMAFDSGCTGVVCSGREVRAIKEKFGDSFLAVTPGIRPSWAVLEKDDQKRVATPAGAVKDGSDLIVIGRPIRDAKDPVRAAQNVIEEIAAVLTG